MQLVNKLSYPVIKKIIQQIGMGLDFIGNYCNMVHCNLKPDNIMLKFPNEEMVC